MLATVFSSWEIVCFIVWLVFKGQLLSYSNEFFCLYFGPWLASQILSPLLSNSWSKISFTLWYFSEKAGFWLFMHNSWKKIVPIQHCEDFPWTEISMSPGFAYSSSQRCAAGAIPFFFPLRSWAKVGYFWHCGVPDPVKGIFWGRCSLEGSKGFAFPEHSLGSPGNPLLNKTHPLNASCLGLCCSSAIEPLQYSNPPVVLYATHGFFWSPISKTTLNMLLKWELKVFVVFIHKVLTACQ